MRWPDQSEKAGPRLKRVPMSRLRSGKEGKFLGD
jgi:hypothetical protein